MATITDVAKRAGVSIATVSYVLNGKTDLVRQETAERIMRAARDLNYSASPVARGLATGSSYTVAVVLPHHYVFSHPIGSQEFLGVAEEFYMSNYSMLIKPSFEDERRMRYPHTRIPTHVAGVLVLGPMNPDNPDLLEALELGKPIVVAEDLPDEWGLTRVNADNYRAAQMVTEHLMSEGHSSFGIISQTNVSPCMARRLEGCMDAIGSRGIGAGSALTADVGSPDEADIGRAMRTLTDAACKPTALIVLSSAMLPGVARVIRERTIGVPEQLAVGCVDYAMPANFSVEWPIVTLKVDLRYQGELAARTLIGMLQSKNGVAESRYIAPELVVLHP